MAFVALLSRCSPQPAPAAPPTAATLEGRDLDAVGVAADDVARWSNGDPTLARVLDATHGAVTTARMRLLQYGQHGTDENRCALANALRCVVHDLSEVGVALQHISPAEPISLGVALSAMQADVHSLAPGCSDTTHGGDRCP